MQEESRTETLGVRVTEREWAVMKAVAFIEDKKMSELIYPWIKPHIEALGQRPDVQIVIAQREGIPAE